MFLCPYFQNMGYFVQITYDIGAPLFSRSWNYPKPSFATGTFFWFIFEKKCTGFPPQKKAKEPIIYMYIAKQGTVLFILLPQFKSTSQAPTHGNTERFAPLKGTLFSLRTIKERSFFETCRASQRIRGFFLTQRIRGAKTPHYSMGHFFDTPKKPLIRWETL